MPCKRILWLTLFVFAGVAAPRVWAADWPQWLGANRNGVTVESGLLKAWPAGGPKLKWKATGLGDGFSYSAPAVARGRIYLLAAFGDAEHVMALDEKDGGTIWSTKIGTVAPNPPGLQNNRPGPRGTPTVDGDKLYALCSGGEIVCVDLAKGAVVWSKSLSGDFGGTPGKWAYSESPLVDGNVVVVSPGGKSATVVGLNKKDGTALWKCAVPGGDNASYGSPIRIEVGGIVQYVSVLQKGIVGVSAKDGKFLWRFDKAANKQGINIPTPMFHDGYLFGVAGYKAGGGVVHLTTGNGKVTAKEIWFEQDLAAVQQIGGFLRAGDYLYGTGNAAKNAVELMCLEFKTGKIMWRHACVGPAELCVADGMLYVRGEKDGTVALVEATPTGYQETGRFKQPDRNTKQQPAWPYPVVANGCLYLRDLGVLLCYDVRDLIGNEVQRGFPRSPV
jgi:outer membrane protein assembly factor BamB